jgi:hypothetical protein
MPQLDKTYTFTGNVQLSGNWRTVYEQVPGKVYDADVIRVEHIKQTATTYRAYLVGEPGKCSAFKVEICVSGYEGKPYEIKVHVSAYYEPWSDSERHLIKTKELTFMMKGDDMSNPLEQENPDVGGKVLDCAVTGVDGHPGAVFKAETVGQRGVLCKGGFVRAEGEKGEPEAQVTVTVVMEHEEAGGEYRKEGENKKEKNDDDISPGQSNENQVTVKGEGNTKPLAKRVALRRAEEAAGGNLFNIVDERYTPQGTSWWCFLTISF